MLSGRGLRQQLLTGLSSFALFLLHCYRGLISPLLMPACRFHPSCSHYALQALHSYGLVRGGWYTLKRLLRCQPWGGQGYDPLPLEQAQDNMRPYKNRK